VSTLARLINTLYALIDRYVLAHYHHQVMVHSYMVTIWRADQGMEDYSSSWSLPTALFTIKCKEIIYLRKNEW